MCSQEGNEQSMSNVEAENPHTFIAGIPLCSFSFAKKSHFSRLKNKYGSILTQSTEELKYIRTLLYLPLSRKMCRKVAVYWRLAVGSRVF